LTGAFVDADTGLVKTQVVRNNDNATASWTWLLSETDQVKLDYTYFDVTYDVKTVNLYDYSQRGPSLSLTHIFSERTQILVQAGISRFDVPQTGTSPLGLPVYLIQYGIGAPVNIIPYPYTRGLESNTYNIQAGFNYALSEKLVANITAGTRKTATDLITETCTSSTLPTPLYNNNNIYYWIGTCNGTTIGSDATDTHGSVYNASLTKNTETLQLTASAKRSIDPSGSGTQVQNDTLTLSAQWSWNERLTFSLSGLYSKVRALENTPAVIDRNYYKIAPSVLWRSGLHSYINLSYSYVHLSYIGEADSVSAQQVNLGYNYSWDKISVSR
jgi:hypothetical protein